MIARKKTTRPKRGAAATAKKKPATAKKPSAKKQNVGKVGRHVTGGFLIHPRPVPADERTARALALVRDQIAYVLAPLTRPYDDVRARAGVLVGPTDEQSGAVSEAAIRGSGAVDLRRLPDDIVPLPMGARVGYTQELRAQIEELINVPPSQGAFWVRDVLHYAADAALDAAATLIETGDTSALENNVLSTIGDLVSRGIRWRILFQYLVGTGWNLSRTAQIMRMSGGAAAVLREINRLGMGALYTAAKAEHGLRPGGKREPPSST